MKSMTGFGRQAFGNADYQIEIEVKSVNHRFLDVQIRMPREYSSLETSLRQVVKKELSRGRVEVGIHIKNERADTKQVVLNWPLLDSLMAQLKEAETRYDSQAFEPKSVISGLINHDDFFKIIETQEQDSRLEAYLVAGLGGALDNLNKSRQIEGHHIQLVLQDYLTDFQTYLHQNQELAVIFEEEYQKKLTMRVQELVGEVVDEGRLLTEVAILIERGDIHEELDRLAIHVRKMEELLGSQQSVGRELDFLIQEMNREVNTIGSKATLITIKESVVQMKTILEKIREQVQNIE